MIKFSNWTIKAVGPVLCRQHDNKTHTVEVVGDIPEGWDWKLLLEHNSMSNIILMEQDESGLHVVLKQEDVPFAGTYKVQLQGTNGELKKHTNQIFTDVRPSIPEQGEAEWPELPTMIEQYDQKVKDTLASMGPDWDQNDPEQPSFIKNRTHYTEITTYPIYREYINEDFQTNPTVLQDFPPFYDGDNVEVIVNGVGYNCTAIDITGINGLVPPEYAGSSITVISDPPFNLDLPVELNWSILHSDIRQSMFEFIALKPVTLYVPGTGDVEVDPEQGLFQIPPGYFPSFKAGDTVTITIDGVEYSRVAIDYAATYPDSPDGATCAFISDGDLSGWDPTSGVAPPCTWIFAYIELREQFIDIKFSNEIFDSSAELTVSYPTGEYGQKEEVKKLPSKYLNLPDWEQNDENGPGYIKNRPFYKLIAEDVVIFETETNAPTSGQGAAKICDLPGDLIPGRTYTIESSEGREEIECVLLTDAETVPWYGELGYPILFSHNFDGGIAQRGGYVANGEEARLISETWWSKDGPLKITGPLDFSKKLNSDLMNAPVNSVNNKTGNVYLYGDDIIENASAIRLSTGYDITVLLPEDDVDAYAHDRPVVCSFPYHNYNRDLSDDESIVSLGGGRCILCAYIGGKQRIFFGKYNSLGRTHIELSGLDEPTLQSSAATKQYVDTEIAKILPPIDDIPNGYVLGISEGKIAWIPKDSA